MNTANSFYTQKVCQQMGEAYFSATAEEYLELIRRLSAVSGFVRINFLAAQLNVNPAAASKMVQYLKNRGLVHFEKYGHISLSAQGQQLVEYLLHRHQIVQGFLCAVNHSTDAQHSDLVEHFLDSCTIKNMELLTVPLRELPHLRFGKME